MKTKLFGIIDYQSALISAIWCGIMFVILNLIFTNINIKIFLFIILTFPIMIFSVVGINGENIVNVVIYMSKFILRQKLLLFDK